MRKNLLTVAISAALSASMIAPFAANAAEQGNFSTESSQGSSVFTINANPSIRISNFTDFESTPENLLRSGQFSLLRVQSICVFSNIGDRQYTITAIGSQVDPDDATKQVRLTDPSNPPDLANGDTNFVDAEVDIFSQNAGGRRVPLILGADVQNNPFIDGPFGGTFSRASVAPNCGSFGSEGRITLELRARTDEVSLLPEGAYSTTVTLIVAPILPQTGGSSA